MKKSYIFILFLITLFTGCSNEGAVDLPEDSYQAFNVITVGKVGRAAAFQDETELPPGDVKALEGNSVFSEGSRIYISQLGNTLDPFASGQSSNLYTYIYQDNPDATWDDNYNFVVKNGTNPLSWTDIRKVGSVGNAFSFFGLSFPGVDEDTEEEIYFSVEKDQTGGKEYPYDQTNFNKSDILGAYHATSALYTRLRFNFFHLMCYLKVTLYVPIYKSEKNEAGQASYSGFNFDDLKEGYVLNSFKDYTISWRSGRSSDIEPPLTYGIGNSTSIKMYMHQPIEDVIQLNDVKKYYDNGDLENDEVYAYNFSVLFPARNSTDNINVSLCFFLQNIDNQMKYYYFQSNWITTESYTPKQGAMQQLYLYLPRTNNKAILVGANILPWGESSTDMTVTSQSTDTIDEESEE